MKQLAEALREEMNRRHHSLRQAAAAMGVSSGSVVNWSKGWIEEAPRTKNLRALADYLGVPLYIILGWKGDLTEQEVELLSTIPGSLKEADVMALALFDSKRYLNRPRRSALISAAS